MHLIFAGFDTSSSTAGIGNANIYQVNLDGTEPKRLTNLNNNATFDLMPSVSADGKTLIFTRGSMAPSTPLGYASNIYSIPIAGESSPAKQLTIDGLSFGGVFNGQFVTYVDIKVTTSATTPSFAGSGIYRMNADGSNQTQLLSVSSALLFF